MKKQVLDVKQMQHLQELGLELKDTMLYWVKPHKGVICRFGNDWNLAFIDETSREYFEYIPAYTLQDVLESLPDFIDEYCLMIDMSYGTIRYDKLTRRDPYLKVTEFNDDDYPFIDAAYEMLCWCIENGYIKTNGNG